MTSWWETVVAVVGHGGLLRKEPVYHARACRVGDGRIDWAGQREGDNYVIRARCGMVLESWKWANTTVNQSSTMLLRVHADKFARPCKRCYR